MTKDKLIDAYWNGEIGDEQFAELGARAGMEIQEIGQVMWDVREEDGTLRMEIA